MVLQIVWYFFLAYNNYLVAAYFNLICLVFSERFKWIGDKFEVLAHNQSRREEMTDETFREIAFRFLEAASLMERSDDFWRSYIFIIMMFVPYAYFRF